MHVAQLIRRVSHQQVRALPVLYGQCGLVLMRFLDRVRSIAGEFIPKVPHVDSPCH